jgi:hypothetical protein
MPRFLCGLLAGVLAACSSSSWRLDSRIPTPAPPALSGQRTANDWHNPFLMVTIDGIDLFPVAPVGGAPQHIPIAKLAATLTSLPRSAWPLGRVVAVTEIGLRSLGDDVRIRANRQAVERILSALAISISRWPS